MYRQYPPPFWILLVALGCHPEPLDDALLATASDWVMVSSPSEDPFFPEDDVEPSYDCSSSAFQVEGDTFEINTGECQYSTFKQAAKSSIKSDSMISALMWHLNLWAEEPAVAHAAIQIGADVGWETRIDIPGHAEVYDIEFQSPESVELGTPIYIHLHNHGVNSWRFGSIVASR